MRSKAELLEIIADVRAREFQDDYLIWTDIPLLIQELEGRLDWVPPPEPPLPTREQVNSYMKHYMRAWRAKRKAEKALASDPK